MREKTRQTTRPPRKAIRASRVNLRFGIYELRFKECTIFFGSLRQS